MLSLMCREMLAPSVRGRRWAVMELLRRATIVTDPRKLAYLNAEAARRNLEAHSDYFPARMNGSEIKPRSKVGTKDAD